MTAPNFIRAELAKAYQIIAMLGWDDSTYTHLTHRHPDKPHFFIQLFGLFFEEVTKSNLVEVDFLGNSVSPLEAEINKTGHAIHSSIYQTRPEINAIFHLHTPESIAVSTDPRGILPISQHAYHFHDRVAYYDYDSLTLHQETQGQKIAKNLKVDVPIMVLRNHGTIVCGKTIQEAFFYQYHLQKACIVQCMSSSITRENPIIPAQKVCEQAQRDILDFEKNLGLRDWQAFCRKLSREKNI